MINVEFELLIFQSGDNILSAVRTVSLRLRREVGRRGVIMKGDMSALLPSLSRKNGYTH